MTTESSANGDQEKRDALRQKIEANERRIAERTLGDQAKDAMNAAVDYTRANPLTVIAGAVAVGVAIGLMTPPGRRAAGKAASSAADAATRVGDATANAASAAKEKVSRAARKRTDALWALLADTLLGYAIKYIDEALESSTAAKDKLEDIGDSAAAKARSLRRDASYMAGTAADKGRTATRRTKRRATRAVRDLTDRVRH